MKKYNSLPYFLAAVMIMLGLMMSACEQSPVSSQPRETRVNFRLQAGEGGSPENFVLRKSNTNRLPAGNRENQLFSERISFGKASEFTGAKVLVLDMTQWATYEEFITAWDSSRQTAFIDTNLWDNNKDLWENYSSMFKSYTGDYYRYHGEFDLSIQDSVARGTALVNPGLNYFFICLRENGKTSYYGETFWLVEEQQNEPVFMEVYPSIYMYISSPADSAVYQPGTEIVFQGYAYDEVNYQDIPSENYVWHSSLDGELGRGQALYLSNLSSGGHTITLTVTASSGAKASDKVFITVGQ